jgi:hypothetical protein
MGTLWSEPETGMYRLILFASFFVRSAEVPELRFQGPRELDAVRTRLESLDRQRLAEVAHLLGIKDPGPAIHVILAADDSDFARGVPPWISGYAVGQSDFVVLFPARSPNYPSGTLEDVLRHELAHVLIWRASGGRPIPRWFNEGLAMAAERQRKFRDQTELLYQLVTGSRTDLEELNHLFSNGQNDQTRAYALAGSLVHDMLQRYGPAAGGEILLRVHGGSGFEAAFEDVTGLTPDRLATEFWHRQRIWSTWVPLIGSSTTLWLAVTVLALLAIYRRQRRNREIEERWAKEEEDDLEH